ncbi:MAG: carbon-nitrogen hydrolase family protein [Acidimicrobiales bacterium]
MTTTPLTVAVAQAASSASGDVAITVSRSALLATRSAQRGARLVVFPELSLVDYDLEVLSRPDAWFSDDDARLDPLREACRADRVWAVVGAPVRSADGRRSLAAVIVAGDGEVLIHPKVHLRGPERDLFDPGDPDYPAGPDDLLDIDGWPAAVAVCADASVPGHAQRAAEAGAALYVVSSYYGPGEHERMGVHMAARAMDHRMFTLCANHARTPSRDSCGGSGIWGPDGHCDWRAGFGVETLTEELDPHHRLALVAADAEARGETVPG